MQKNRSQFSKESKRVSLREIRRVSPWFDKEGVCCVGSLSPDRDRRGALKQKKSMATWGLGLRVSRALQVQKGL